MSISSFTGCWKVVKIVLHLAFILVRQRVFIHLQKISFLDILPAKMMSYFLLQERHLLVDFDLKLLDKVLHETTVVSFELNSQKETQETAYITHIEMFSIEECMTKWGICLDSIQSFCICRYPVKRKLSIGITTFENRFQIMCGCFSILFKL